LQLEFSGSKVSQRAMRPGLIIIYPPCLDDLPNLIETHEPVLVQTFIPELAVEALHVAIINRFAWTNELQLDAARICPGIYRVADKLRTIVYWEGVTVGHYILYNKN
jgi:hypothetical protein